MKEGQLRKLLAEIEDNTERKEIADICMILAQNFAKYQEQQLEIIRRRVEEEICYEHKDYAIDMICCERKDVKQWEEWFTPLLFCGMHQVVWGTGAIERVYIQADEPCIQHELETHPVYRAVIHTNYETYPVTVTLKQVKTGIRLAEKINRLMMVAGVNMPDVNACCLTKFYDVCFETVKDRIRQDEIIESVEVDWGDFKKYICHDCTLLWNVRELEIKERQFPNARAQKNEVRYCHEILLPDQKCAYLVEVPNEEGYQVVYSKECIKILTREKKYKDWKMYEITPKDVWCYSESEEAGITNRVQISVFDDISCRRRIFTEAEIYRRLMSYEVTGFFAKIEMLADGEVDFYPKDREHYLNHDIMQFIIKDMNSIFRGYDLHGRLIVE